MEAGNIEELSDSGTMTARYTTENGSYYGQWLHLYRPNGSMSRFPMYDNIGTARGLLDASGTATDWYELDTFGRQVSSSGTTPNPYRFGGAWGYITDPSGMLQLGQRFYWPETGRFVSQDPLLVETNRYVYVTNSPLRLTDPEGLLSQTGAGFATAAVLCAPIAVIGLGSLIGCWGLHGQDYWDCVKENIHHFNTCKLGGLPGALCVAGVSIAVQGLFMPKPPTPKPPKPPCCKNKTPQPPIPVENPNPHVIH